VTLSRSSVEVEYRGVAKVVADLELIARASLSLEDCYVEHVAAGHVRVVHVASRYQLTNIFTECLSYALFDDFHSILNVRPPTAPSAEGC
ncbi:hypothetical protein Tco_1511832, partial [Tanacetum coccineum]